MEEDIWRVWEGQIKAYAVYSPSSDGLSAEASLIEQWITDYQITMTVLTDWGGDVYSEWKITDPDSYAPYPREYLIDRQGNISYISSDIEVDDMRAAIEAALADN